MNQAERHLLQNKYEIISKIKQGGFGIVYYGFDRVFDKPVAIKAVEPALLQNADYTNLFLNEAKNAAKLSHNNIVHIFDLVQEQDGQYFIIMEFVEGFDLGRILRQCKKKNVILPIDISVYILKEVCKALEYAHNKRSPITNQPLKLIHHDITPSNLMISLEGQVKLIDFGLAKLRIKKTKPGEIVISGKIPYLAPEQVTGGQIDRRTDIFSLGVVFYEMLTGSRLIDSKEAKEAVQQITKGELDTAKLEQQNVPLPIQKILQKMLQKDPDQRYFGASGVYLDLVEFLMANTFSVELSKELGDYIQGLYDNKVKPGQPAPVLAEPVIRDSKEPDSEPVLQEIIIKQPSSDVPPELDNQADEKKPQLVEKQQEQEKEKEGQELPISSTNSVENVAEINQNAEIEKILLEIENDFKQEINKKNGASTGETSGALEKNEKMEEPVSSEKVRRDQPATISQTFLDDDEVQDDLKTIFDVIRLSTKSHLKGIKIASVVLLSLLLLFLVFDFFQQFTPIGTALYERIYPPAIKIVTVPPGAAVYLDEKRIPGETPISIPEIASGVYQLFLTHEGFKPLKKSIHVPITGKIKISGETKPSDSLTFLFRFKAGINLNSNPSGATIYLNDVQYPQQTPVSFEWEAGAPLSIEMTHAGLNRISGLTLNSGGDEINIEDDRIWSYQAFDSPVKKIQIEAIFTKTFTLNIIPNDVVWFVDGSSVPAGTTSVSNTFSLPLGEHEILFKKQGFNDKLITLRADENTPEIVSLVLDRTVRFIAKQNASADSNEIDAKITRYVLRNKSYALNKVTPCDVTLPAVNVRVYIEKDGYKKANLVVPAEKRQVAFTLEISAVSVEISVFDALTDIPLENTSITYEITTGDLTEDVLFGITDYDGKCVNSLKSGEYNFKVKKDGYYEKQMVFNTLNTDEQKMEFKLIIQ